MKFKATIFAALMGFAMLASLDANAGGNSTWTLCINGVDLKTGGWCGTPRHGHGWHKPGHGHGHGHHNPGHGHGHNNPGHNVRPGFITLRGHQAYNLIRTGYIMDSSIGWDGNELYRVKTFGHGHRPRIWDCRITPAGFASCQSWKHNR